VQTGRTFLRKMKMLDKELAHRGVERPVTVLSDGHATREDEQVMEFCASVGIRLHTEPGNSSGFLQALDQCNKGFHQAYIAGLTQYRNCYRNGGHASIDLGAFIEIVVNIWFTWCTKLDRQVAFRRVGITNVINAQLINRDRFMHTEQALDFEREKRAEAQREAAGGGDLAPLFSPLPPPGTMKSGTKACLEWQLSEMTRVNANLVATPLMPSEVGLLNPDYYTPAPKSRRRIEPEQGSFTLRGLLDKKRTQTKKRYDEQLKQTKGVEERAANKAANAAEEVKNATAWRKKNTHTPGWCVCNLLAEQDRVKMCCKQGHLCKWCGVVKKNKCRVGKCLKSWNDESDAVTNSDSGVVGAAEGEEGEAYDPSGPDAF
jgi:hypothetical protein